MTAENKISVEKAIEILKSGGDLGKSIIADLDTSKVKAMDALLLAENGFLVPDGNIVYDDKDIRYDSDFDEVDWGKPVSFEKERKQLENSPAEEELIIRLQIKNEGMKEWLQINREKLDEVIHKLLEDLYKTERLLKE